MARSRGVVMALLGSHASYDPCRRDAGPARRRRSIGAAVISVVSHGFFEGARPHQTLYASAISAIATSLLSNNVQSSASATACQMRSTSLIRRVHGAPLPQLP